MMNGNDWILDEYINSITLIGILLNRFCFVHLKEGNIKFFSNSFSLEINHECMYIREQYNIIFLLGSMNLLAIYVFI